MSDKPHRRANSCVPVYTSWERGKESFHARESFLLSRSVDICTCAHLCICRTCCGLSLRFTARRSIRGSLLRHADRAAADTERHSVHWYFWIQWENSTFVFSAFAFCVIFYIMLTKSLEIIRVRTLFVFIENLHSSQYLHSAKEKNRSTPEHMGCTCCFTLQSNALEKGLE